MQTRSLAFLGLLLAGAVSGCASNQMTLVARKGKTAARRRDVQLWQERHPRVNAPEPVKRLPAVSTEAVLPPSQDSAPLTDLGPAFDHRTVSSLEPDIQLASARFDGRGTFSASPATDSKLFYEMPDLTRLPPTDGGDATLLDEVTNRWSLIRTDHTEFYSLSRLTTTFAGVGVGALMANTPFDESVLHDVYAENVVLAPTHEFVERLHQPKILGDGRYTIPLFVVTALSEPLLDDLPYGSAVAEWGERSLRTLLVGGPPMLGLQYLTGGSRPGETSHESKWTPLQDNNGVSGHSFMGAIPFLSAAKMTDNRWLKAGCYTVSVLPAISRINDDDHYPSQAFLGWWLALAAASAVDRSQALHVPDNIHLLPQADGLDVVIEY